MSRTNHPRVTGTHRALSVGKEHYERGTGQVATYGTPLSAVESFRATARARIDEGLAQMAAPLDLDERWTERECMSEWEALDEWSVVTGPDRMADWEIALLTGVDQDEAMSIAWSSVTSEPSLGEFAAADPDPTWDEDDSEGYFPSTWLMGTVEECFPDGGYIVTGPAPQPSVRAAGYLRVHEAAALLECTSASLIHRLRYRGEWVTNAASYVARPVIEALYAEGLEPFISGELTLAEPKPIDPIDALRARLTLNRNL